MWRGWLNFVHEKGGCRGRELDWDAAEPLADGGYDEQTRGRATAKVREMIERIKAQSLSNMEPFDDDDNSEEDPREYTGREAD